MEEVLSVQSSSHAYEIIIGADIRFRLLEYLPKNYSSILIVTDDKVAKLYLEDIRTNFSTSNVFEAIVPSGEQSKSFDTYYALQTKAIECGLDRQSLIIALGGGVVGDLAGFVAATFMRGIDYIQVPTTILAHDSSVGGKVAINHEQGKNLIGNFYPPQAVVYDVNTLHSLKESEIRSGYAELVKEALIADHKFYQALMDIDLNELTNGQLTEHLRKGIEIKASIVEADEKESNVRMYLNLGHTLAHAIEAELGYGSLTHGEAVAIGLLFALKVSEDYYEVELPYGKLSEWLQQNGYPLKIDDLPIYQLIDKMKHDKKAVNQRIQMVLLEQIGNPKVVTLEDHTIEKHLRVFMERVGDANDTRS